MAQQQQNLHVAAPAFKGLNTQDSPVGLGMEFADTADNCVIDRFGRIAVRKGFTQRTDNPDALGGVELSSSFIFTADDGTQFLLVAGDNRIWDATGNTMIDLALPVGVTITDDNWQFCQLNGVCYMVQRGHVPLKFSDETLPGTFVLEEWTELPSALPGQTALGTPDTITAGFGRIFCGNFDGGQSLLTWSNLLDGDGYTTATDPASDSGFFDLEEFWPYGHDETVSIRVHNNFLIIWGKESILVYSIPENGPAFGVLSDTIEGIGCAGRDTVVPIGQDIFYLDYTGVRSFARTIQEKSVPIGDVSANIRDDIIEEIQATDNLRIRGVYDAENSFYVVFFPSGTGSSLKSNVYVFDTRSRLENGAHRPTRWPQLRITGGSTRPDGIVQYIGLYGVYAYTGYSDVRIETNGADAIADPIPMLYQTHPQTWDQPVSLKFPKQVDVTVIGGQNYELCISWAYDYSTNFSQGLCRLIDYGRLFEYNEDAEYNTFAEYGGNAERIRTEQFNVWGNGRNVKYRFEADVSAAELSFQEINIQTTLGRII